MSTVTSVGRSTPHKLYAALHRAGVASVSSPRPRNLASDSPYADLLASPCAPSTSNAFWHRCRHFVACTGTGRRCVHTILSVTGNRYQRRWKAATHRHQITHMHIETYPKRTSTPPSSQTDCNFNQCLHGESMLAGSTHTAMYFCISIERRLTTRMCAADTACIAYVFRRLRSHAQSSE